MPKSLNSKIVFEYVFPFPIILVRAKMIMIIIMGGKKKMSGGNHYYYYCCCCFRGEYSVNVEVLDFQREREREM